jgi:hypothetical protein
LQQFGEASAGKQLLLSNVATSSERILEVMDGVTALYQKLA